MKNNRKKSLALSLLMIGAIFATSAISAVDNPTDVDTTVVENVKKWEVLKNIKNVCSKVPTWTKDGVKKAYESNFVKSHGKKVLIGTAVSAVALTGSYFVWKKFIKNNDKKVVNAEQA